MYSAMFMRPLNNGISTGFVRRVYHFGIFSS
jgi:hypothetical protein